MTNDIGKICRNLMQRQTFYGLFLLNLNKEFSTSLPTAGVGLNGINQMLYINPEFWDKLSDKHKEGLLIHELLHICFFHLTMRNSFVDKKLFNIAADLEINQYIDNDYLPDGAIVMTSFPTLTLELKAGTNYYYQKLLENNNSKDPDPGLQSLMGGQSGPPTDGDGDLHPTWKEFENLTDTEKKLIQNQVEHILKESATQITKSRGTIPGELKSLIDELFKITEEVFNWKAYFRRKMGCSSEVYTKKSRRKMSKRFEDNAGIKIKQKHHILVAVDTSGSVSNAELLEFFSEIHHIYKAGASVTIIECDTKINDIYEYKGKFKGSVVGRGGTDFTPPVEYYNKHKNKFTTLVFFTDGYAPVECKPHKQMMWVISSAGTEDLGLFPGYKIKIPKIN
jgi:predicted metal-dependent peptidase